MIQRLKQKAKSALAKFLSRYSHYHYIAHQWDAITDLEVLEKAITTAYFNNQLKSIQPALNRYKKVLILAPHQDDESIGCGGLMQLLHEQEAKIAVLYTTDGRQNNLNISPEETIKLRNKEAKNALAIVNADFYQLDINNIAPIVEFRHIETLVKQIDDFQPDLILLPWLFDSPIKHRLTNHFFALCCSLIKNKDLAVWGYQVHNHLFPNIGIDISSVVDGKLKMINCFKSQNNHFKDYTHQTIGLNAFNSKYIKNSRYVEVFFGLPLIEYKDLVLKWYENHPLSVYRGNHAFIDNMNNLKKEIKSLDRRS